MPRVERLSAVHSAGAFAGPTGEAGGGSPAGSLRRPSSVRVESTVTVTVAGRPKGAGCVSASDRAWHWTPSAQPDHDRTPRVTVKYDEVYAAVRVTRAVTVADLDGQGDGVRVPAESEPGSCLPSPADSTIPLEAKVAVSWPGLGSAVGRLRPPPTRTCNNGRAETQAGPRAQACRAGLAPIGSIAGRRGRQLACSAAWKCVALVAG